MKLDDVYEVTSAAHLAAEMVERMAEIFVARKPTETLSVDELIAELEEELIRIRMRLRTKEAVLAGREAGRKLAGGDNDL